MRAYSAALASQRPMGAQLPSVRLQIVRALVDQPKVMLLAIAELSFAQSPEQSLFNKSPHVRPSGGPTRHGSYLLVPTATIHPDGQTTVR
jgi:hypothetical protein